MGQYGRVTVASGDAEDDPPELLARLGEAGVELQLDLNGGGAGA